MATLRLVPTSESAGTPQELKGDFALVGREPGCDVVVSDGSVSRKHARLERRPGGWTVVDQGSANGTFLDSQRVAEAVLRGGQELRFGAVGFKVELEEDDLAATMVATPSPDATVVAPPHMMPTPPLGIPSSTPLGPSQDAPPPPKPAVAAPPKAGPPPLARPPAPAPAPPPPLPAPAPAPPRVATPAAAPPLPASPSAAAAKDRFGTRPVAAAAGGPGPVGQMAPPPLAEKKGRSPIVWVIAGCCGCLLLGLLAVAGIGGAAFFATQAPASTVQSHLTEIRRGDLAAAYGRLSPELQAQLPPAEFEQLVRDHPALGQNKDATFWNRSVNNDGAKLTGVLTGTSGDVEPATFELQKQGGDWRITAIRLGADAQ